MNPLDLTRICRLAPYKVWTEDGRDYYVETSRGQIFDIGFMDDYSIWPTGAYQFTISNQSHQPSPLDQKLRETILLLIEAFFAARSTFGRFACKEPRYPALHLRDGRRPAGIPQPSLHPMVQQLRGPRCLRPSDRRSAGGQDQALELVRFAKQRTSQPLSCRSQTLASRKSSPNSTKPSAY